MTEITHSSPQILSLMHLALEEAALAAAEGEVPIGAVLAVGEQVIARNHNRIEQLHDATSHAEMLVIREASAKLGAWRLTSATLVVTLEPCPMCLGAIRLARIPNLIFAASDSRFGACGSTVNLCTKSEFGPELEVVKGVMQEEAAKLLKEFFQKRRG